MTDLTVMEENKGMGEKISLLEKLGKARIDFQSASIKKTGKNKFVGFDYYELSDVLPKINELSKTYRFICVVSFNAETASLKVIDIDDQNQSVEFTSPMAGVNLKGAHEIQNMGAVQTYMRRYLYMMAFEIVECDTFDGGLGKKEPENGKPTNGQNGKPPENGKPETNEVEKEKIGKLIGEILETKNPEGLPYFREQEIAMERENYMSGDLQSVIKQHEKLQKYLEARKGANNGK